MKTIKSKILSILTISLLIYGCYKEDVSELYSRQYIVTFKKAVDDFQKDIDDLRDLYNKLNNRPIATKVEYVRDPQGDIYQVKVTINDKDFTIPYPKTPKPATISISGDGFWIINGVKTNTPVNVKGDKGDSGQTPIIGIKQDTDGNYYWTLQMPNETTSKWLTDSNGNKVQANGIQGQKGDKGDKGQDGQPGTLSFVTDIQEKDNPDGTKSLQIYTRDNKIYTIPLTQTEIALKLTLEAMTTTDSYAGSSHQSIGLNTEGVLHFDNVNQSVTIPYTHTNVSNLLINVPTGWLVKKDTSAQTITLIAPSITRVTSSNTSMEGDLSVIGLDEKGKAVSQHIKVALQAKIYYSYFYYPLKVIETDRPNSPQNQLSVEGINPIFQQDFYQLKQGTYEHIGKANPDATAMSNLKIKDPNFSIQKKKEYVHQSFNILSVLYDSKYAEYVTLNIGADGQPKSRALATHKLNRKIRVDQMNQEQELVKPVHHNTYMSLHPFLVNETSNNETIRFRRIASKIRIVIPVQEYQTIMGISAIDLDKVSFQLTNTSEFVTSEFVRYNRVTTEVKKEYDGVKLEIKDGNLYCEFAIFGTSDNQYNLYLLYDGVVKKKWRKYLGLASIPVINRDYHILFKITNGKYESPFAGATPVMDYIGFNAAEQDNDMSFRNGELLDP